MPYSNMDMKFDKLYSIYKKYGRIQAREILLKMTIPELIELCYFLHESTVGRKTPLIDRIMNHMDIKNNLEGKDSVKFFDDDFHL